MRRRSIFEAYQKPAGREYATTMAWLAVAVIFIPSAERPATIQELTFQPNLFRSSTEDPVSEVSLSFYNGEVYRLDTAEAPQGAANLAKKQAEENRLEQEKARTANQAGFRP